MLNNRDLPYLIEYHSYFLTSMSEMVNEFKKYRYISSFVRQIITQKINTIAKDIMINGAMANEMI